MNDNKPLHFDFLLEEERVSSSPLRLRFLLPVLGVLCLLGPLVCWQVESSALGDLAARKQSLEGEITRLKPGHELVLKDRAEEKELAAQLQQLSYYRASKNPLGAALGNLTNCVTSLIQLTELHLKTQMPPPLPSLQPKPKNALELGKLCPTNLTDQVTLYMKGRSIQQGGKPTEVHRFQQALQDKAFSNLVNQASRPAVKFTQEVGYAARPGEVLQDIVLFEITYEALPRRFQ